MKSQFRVPSSKNVSNISCKKTDSQIYKKKNIHKAFEITLMADQNKLQKELSSEDPSYVVPTILKFNYKNNEMIVPVLSQQRGNSRRDYCTYKPLKISFLNSKISDAFTSTDPEVAGGDLNVSQLQSLNLLYLESKRPDASNDFTPNKSLTKPFKGLGKHMKIVSHCGESSWDFLGGKNKKEQEQTVLQEYYLYKIQNILYPLSLQTQLIKINYKNEKNELVETALGFFRERAERTAKRCGFREMASDVQVEKETYNSFDKTAYTKQTTENPDRELKTDIASSYQAQFLMLLFHNYDYAFMKPDSENRYEYDKDSEGKIIGRFTNTFAAHNVAVVISEDSKLHFIPYDFDLSTLITQRSRFDYYPSDSESLKQEARDWKSRISTTKKRVRFFRDWITGAPFPEYFWYSGEDTNKEDHLKRGKRNIKNFLDKTQKIERLIKNSLLSNQNKNKFLDWLEESNKGLKNTLKEIND